MYRIFICQSYDKGDLVAKEFGKLFWDEVTIDALIKRGRGCKQNGNGFTIFSLSNSKSNKLLLQMKNKYLKAQLHYLSYLPF